MYTLNAILEPKLYTRQSITEFKDENVASAIKSRDYKQFTDVVSEYRVRRLTPLECERLQGLPDGYTEGGSDTARYKALGNGMAQPCADFVMERVVEAIRNATDDGREN